MQTNAYRFIENYVLKTKQVELVCQMIGFALQRDRF